MNMPYRSHILIIDDDAEMRSLLSDFLSNNGHKVTEYPLASEALKALEKATTSDDNKFDDLDLIVSDIKMPEMTGLEFVKKIRDHKMQTPVILITAFGNLESAIDAIRLGAFDYIVKPFKLAEINLTIERAIGYHKLEKENKILRQELQKTWQLGDMIGKSPGMRSVFDLVQRVAPAHANVLITGESGTGKEMVAQAIHTLSGRASKPFVAINCTAIPENLLESELFGHAKGSFTGAIQRKKGLFEEAEGGTIFLDEIGDMDLSLQAKLLRVIQERKIKAVGDNQYKDIDVRIIAATHKDLKSAIKNGSFREDLYYRLSVIPIAIPPLRHRKEDIPILAEFFLRKYSATNGSHVQGFAKSAISKMMGLRWEGNVRELENLVERAVVLCQGTHIGPELIPSPEDMDNEQFFAQASNDFPTLEDLERRYIEFILDKTGGRKEKTSQILGINRRTLYRKEREYGLVQDDGSEYMEDESHHTSHN